MPAGIALNPMDRFFLALHRTQVRRGLPGMNCLAYVELAGSVDAAALRGAWVAAQARHPVLSGGLAVEHGCWQARQGAGDAPAACPLKYHDLSSEKEADAARWRIVREAMERPRIGRAALFGAAGGEAGDAAGAPPAELLHMRREDGRDFVALVWPHALMDGAGGLQLLEELGRSCGDAAAPKGVDRGARDARSSGGGDATTTAPCVNAAQPGADGRERWFRWTPAGVTRAARAHWAVRRFNRLHGLRFHERRDRPALPVTLAPLAREGAAWEAVRRRAQAACRAGPSLYSRFFLMAALRSVDAMREALGMHEREHYLAPFPMTWQAGVPACRMFHNHVTIATLVVPRALLADDAALDGLLLEQIEAYRARRRDRDFLALADLFGRMRPETYDRAVEGRHAFPRYSFGFSTMNAPEGLSQFLGCEVAACGVGGLPPSPPGVLINFCRGPRRLELVLMAYGNVCPAEMARELTARIAEELVGR